MNCFNKFNVFKVAIFAMVFCADATEYIIDVHTKTGDRQSFAFSVSSSDYTKMKGAWRTINSATQEFEGYSFMGHVNYTPLVLEEVFTAYRVAQAFCQTEPLGDTKTPWNKFLEETFSPDGKYFLFRPADLLEKFAHTLDASKIKILSVKTVSPIPNTRTISSLRVLTPAILVWQTNHANQLVDFLPNVGLYFLFVKTLFQLSNTRPTTFDYPVKVMAYIYTAYALFSGSWDGFINFAMTHMIAVQIAQWWLDGWALFPTIIRAMFYETTYSQLVRDELCVKKILLNNKACYEERCERKRLKRIRNGEAAEEDLVQQAAEKVAEQPKNALVASAQVVAGDAAANAAVVPDDVGGSSANTKNTKVTGQDVPQLTEHTAQAATEEGAVTGDAGTEQVEQASVQDVGVKKRIIWV